MSTALSERNASFSQAIGFHIGRETYAQSGTTRDSKKVKTLRFLGATLDAVPYYLLPNFAHRFYFRPTQTPVQEVVSWGINTGLDTINIVGAIAIAGVTATDVLGLRYPDNAVLVWSTLAVAKIGTNALNNYLMGKINRRLDSVSTS